MNGSIHPGIRMEKGICLLRFIALRAEPSEKSEMVSQLLFGEAYEINEEKADWLKIRTEFDGYSGWIDKKMFSPVIEEYYQKLTGGGYVVAGQITETVLTPKHAPYTVAAGSTLGFPMQQGILEINSMQYRLTGQTNSLNQISPADIIEIALRFLNSPYLWGGRSPFGYDCSGFTQMVYKISGSRLPRDAWQQASVGRNIDMLKKATQGDLVFFANDDDLVVHAGLAIPPAQIIHCSGMVRIDSLDEKGIFNRDIRQYTHRLHSIRRLL